MPNPRKQWWENDLAYGLAAVAVLCVLSFGLHVPYLLGLGASAAIYFGLSLSLRRPAEVTPAAPSLSQIISDLENLGGQIHVPNIRLQTAGISDQAQAILVYLNEHPDAALSWQDYLRECLDSALAGTQQFVELSRHLPDPADPAAVKFSEFLQTLADTLSGVYKKLIASDAADFAAHIDAYRNTLHEINQVYLGGGKPE